MLSEQESTITSNDVLRSDIIEPCIKIKRQPPNSPFASGQERSTGVLLEQRVTKPYGLRDEGAFGATSKSQAGTRLWAFATFNTYDDLPDML